MLANKDSHQRETITKWPICLALSLYHTTLALAALPLWWWNFCIQHYAKISPSERQSGERQASMNESSIRNRPFWIKYREMCKSVWIKYREMCKSVCKFGSKFQAKIIIIDQKNIIHEKTLSEDCAHKNRRKWKINKLCGRNLIMNVVRLLTFSQKKASKKCHASLSIHRQTAVCF